MVNLSGIYRLRVNFFGYLPDSIRVIRLYEQPLGSMTQEYVNNEGFRTLNEFK
jgi:hypothetical protein